MANTELLTNASETPFKYVRNSLDGVNCCRKLLKRDRKKKLGFTPCKAGQPLREIRVTGKRSPKRLKYKGNLSERTYT